MYKSTHEHTPTAAKSKEATRLLSPTRGARPKVVGNTLIMTIYDYSLHIDSETGCDYVRIYPKWWELAKQLPPDSRLSFWNSLFNLLFDTSIPIPIKTVLINILERNAIGQIGNK